MKTKLKLSEVRTTYGKNVISESVTLEIPAAEFTAIIGPNACGKSTLLSAIARLHKPDEGSIVLDGREVYATAPRQLARRLGLLPQEAKAPEKMTVRELVAHGRSPHQSLFRQWSSADREAVDLAMAQTGVADLADREVDALSGGQRQRVWLALVLAQQTETILLDEPVSFLDLAHHIDILELCQKLCNEGRTVVAVLHDLNLALRYASNLVVMKDGAVVGQGPPREVVTEQLLEHVYGVRCLVTPDPLTHEPMVIPRPRLKPNS